jgi:hypothetical protein
LEQLPPQSVSVSLPFFTRSLQVAAWHLSGDPEQAPLRQSLATRHVFPSAHLLQLAPPQSVSVSVPFFTESLHVAAWHLSGEPEQTPLWQSAAVRHVLVSAHFGQLPPQSMSVSVPFLTESLHMADWHLSGLPVQTPLVQSLPVAQVLVSAHLGHAAPPQSTSVSVPFFTTSLHVGALHVPPVHTPFTQSLPVAQVLVSAHLPHVPPPQSMSVSAPFFTRSLHVGA